VGKLTDAAFFSDVLPLLPDWSVTVYAIFTVTLHSTL
jgi:hypothetical protein